MAIFSRKATEGEKEYFKDYTFWECEPSKFDYVYPNDETCVVTEGYAEITADGQITVLEPGVLAFFPKGTNCVWNISKTVKKYFR